MMLQNCDNFLSVAESVLSEKDFLEIKQKAHTEECAKAAILGIIDDIRLKPGQKRLLISLLGQTTDYYEYKMLEKFPTWNAQAAWQEVLDFAADWQRKSPKIKFTCRICGKEFTEQKHLVDDPLCDDCLPVEFAKLFNDILTITGLVNSKM